MIRRRRVEVDRDGHTRALVAPGCRRVGQDTVRHAARKDPQGSGQRWHRQDRVRRPSPPELRAGGATKDQVPGHPTIIASATRIVDGREFEWIVNVHDVEIRRSVHIEPCIAAAAWCDA
eukprot:746357-Prymnesium_polylepis.1